MYSVLLPICTVATAVKATCKSCGREFGCDSNPHSERNLATYVVILTVEAAIPRAKNGYFCLLQTFQFITTYTQLLAHSAYKGQIAKWNRNTASGNWNCYRWTAAYRATREWAGLCIIVTEFTPQYSKHFHSKILHVNAENLYMTVTVQKIYSVSK
jgi:hypothetical protein